jgi:hypothetical protein
MFIKLLAKQIPDVWESIKFAATKVDSISEKDAPLYLNRLLAMLLSDKAQCFIRLDEERQLIALVITLITIDEITGVKALLIKCLYSFQGVQIEEWAKDLEYIKMFARNNGCFKIITFSNSQRVFEIANEIGFIERYRSFGMEV